MILRDQKETRIDVSAITSFYPDRQVIHGSTASSSSIIQSIVLTIGTTSLTVLYKTKDLRDQDLKELDILFKKRMKS